MIDPTVLMRRAVRSVCDSHNLTPASLTQFDHVTQEQFRDLAITVADDMRYNALL